MDNCKELLTNYTPILPEEIRFKERMLDFLNLYEHKAFLRSNTVGHFTASAWVHLSSTNEVLLLHHRKLDKWLQPGGHADGNSNLHEVAIKELEEEAGINYSHIDNIKIFDIDIHTIPANSKDPQHLHLDVRFKISLTKKPTININNESKGYEWVQLDKVKELSTETSILRMVSKTKA